MYINYTLYILVYILQTTIAARVVYSHAIVDFVIVVFAHSSTVTKYQCIYTYYL